jgi:lysophospholipid acyltransferase (LPLAT)-like uncharacterized protein
MNKVLIKRLPSRIVIYVIAILMKIWMCFVVLSCRKIVIRKEYAEAMQIAEDSHIKAIWHRNILLGPLATLKKKSYATLVTPHEDGEVGVAYAILSRFKIVRGSGTGSSNKRKPKDKKGVAAFRKLLRYLSDGTCGWITVDIPPGPKFECGKGVIVLARLSQKPIMATAVRTQNEAYIKKSWDQFIIHKPFGKLVIAYGKPIYVPKDADDEIIEAYRLKLEKNLNELHAKAENLLKG